MTVNIDVAPDSPPIVLGTAQRLRRSAAQPQLASRLQKMKGVLAMKSAADPQSVTIRFDRGDVKLSSGVASDAGVVITLDFNDPNAKPFIVHETLKFVDLTDKQVPPNWNFPNSTKMPRKNGGIDFAQLYTDQCEKDFALFQQEIAAGRIPVEIEPGS